MMSTDDNGVARRVSRAPGMRPENTEKKAKKVKKRFCVVILIFINLLIGFWAPSESLIS